MNKLSIEEIQLIENVACDMRFDILKMVHNCGKQNGHLGGCMSTVEILAVLYTKIMNIIDVAHSDKDWSMRDRFIMSKGHAGIAMYAAMKHAGLVSQEMINNSIRGEKSVLFRHPKRNIEYGIECSVGSLGMGLGYGNGLAEAFKRRGTDQKVYVMIGDGECDEGSVWESASYASHRGLDNLIAIIDMNRLQLDGPTKDILSMENMAERWKAFGFETVEIDGHNIEEIYEALRIKHEGKPLAIIAHTSKGKGMSFAENKTEWHDNYLSDELYEQGKLELGNKKLDHLREMANSLFETRRVNVSKAKDKIGYAISDSEEQISKWQELGPKNVIGDVALKLAEQDELFTLIYSDCANRIGIKELQKKHPEKCYETGISEQNQLTIAAAMAHEGFHVYAVAYAPFITARVLDQIRTNLGYMKSSVCLIGLGAGMASSDLGATHTSFEDISNMRSIPNILVNAPADVYEVAKGMEYFVNNPQPMYLRVTVGNNIYSNPISYNPLKTDFLRQGNDLVILATGTLLSEVLKAAEILKEDNIEATVINVRTIKPIEKSLIDEISRFDLVVTVEEHSVIGGLGSAIAEEFVKQGRSSKVKMLGIQDEYFYADICDNLLERCGLDVNGIAKSVETFVRE